VRPSNGAIYLPKAHSANNELGQKTSAHGRVRSGTPDPINQSTKHYVRRGLGAYCFFEVNPSIVNAHAFEAVHTGQQTALPLD
jgi:hypothetical protein